MLQLTKCPICESNTFNSFVKCVDYTVSRETFPIVNCSSCEFKFTNPIPDLNELGSYYKSDEYISHSNTKKGFINSCYQTIRKYTLIKKLRLISKFYRTGNLLDIGCGTGEFLETCKRAKWNVLGIEPDESARRMAIDNFSLDVRPEQDLKNLKDESFDIITMWHVLEHVPDLKGRIKELRRLLKPKGLIIIAVPNCSSLDAKLYQQYWAAYDVPRHLYHFTPNDVERLMGQFDLKVFNILPMVFDSFYVSMLSEKYRTGKINLIRSMWNGLRSNLNAIKTGREYSSQIYLIKKN